MSLPREPLHQPPNPDDLRRVVPATPECATVRGMLRDFVDQDLSSEQVRHVEEHASRCRTCSIELARAEHEVLRLRAFFAMVGGSEQAAPSLRPDFAARLVERLVLDETSMVDAAAVARAVAAADAQLARERQERRSSSADSRAETAGDDPRRDDPRRSARVSPLFALCGALVLLCVLVLVGGLLRDDAMPQPVARLVVLEAASTFDIIGRPLGAGSGVGEHQSLKVSPGGGARIDWHDLAAGPQPAATLQVRGEGQVRMRDGAPLLLNGRIDIATNRPVSVPLGDGSQIDFGIGDYTVIAEVAMASTGDEPVPTSGGSLADAPSDLRVRVEVQSGAAATIVRTTFMPTMVVAGQVGVYSTNTPVSVSTGGIAAAAPESPPRAPVTPGGGLSDQALLIGHVHERNGTPSSGAQIYYQFASGGAVQSGARVTGADGQFLVASDNTCDSEFAIVLALPAELRRELGMLVPDAVQVVKNGNSTQFASPLVFDLAAPVDGLVVDDLLQPRSEVQVIPCLVDELFAGVMPLDSARVTTAIDGRFRIERLPARLPPHQTLVLVFAHEGLEPLMRAVPVRGGVLANEPLGSVAMRRLRTIRFADLPHNADVEILEAVDAADNLLPEGSVLRRRIAHTSWNGNVPSYSAGFGRLWYRVGSSQPQMIRELELQDFSGVPLFRPHGPARPFSDVFRPVQPVFGTSLEMASVYRHQRFQVVGPVDAAQSQVLRVLDDLGRSVAGAQVFAVDQSGAQGRAEIRFLGFTSSIGALSLEPVRDDGDLVVLAVDGSLAFVAEPQQLGPSVTAILRAPGRVLLHESVRPTDGSRSVMIKFERLDDPLGGLRPYAVRFASDSNGWEFTDLPPGTYRAVAHNQVHTLTVPSVGFVVLD